MKYKFTLLLMLVFVSSVSLAQIKFGFEGGLNFSTISQNFADSGDETNVKPRVGYRLGVLVDYSLNDALSFRSGLKLTSKGTATDIQDQAPNGIDADGYNRIIINYLEMPLNVAYSLGPVRAVGGFYLAAGISAKNKYDFTFSGNFGGTTFSETEKGSDIIDFNTGKFDPDNNNEEINRFDFGVNIGVEYDLAPVTLTLSYAKGFSNLTLNDPEDPDFDKADFKTTNSTLSLGVIYFLGK